MEFPRHALVAAVTPCLHWLGGCTITTSRTPAPSAPTPVAAASVTGPLTSLPPVTTDNRNLLIAAAPAEVTVSASSSYGGWPASNATDGKLQTSWYSDSNDSAAHGRAPFIQLSFATPSIVRRVTVLGNRDPSYLQGYTILTGKLELLDASGRVIGSFTTAGVGNRRDFDFRLPAPAANVTTIRFTSLADEGNQNPYGDVAIAEIQVE